MTQSLWPTFQMPATVQQRQQATPRVTYRPSYRFDFERGDFALDGAGRVPLLDGHAAWGQWVVKTCLTERFAHLVYSRRHGVELERSAGHPNRAVAQTAIARSITEALAADPRTGSVAGFTFAWAGDTLTVSFVATPAVGTPLRVEVPLVA